MPTQLLNNAALPGLRQLNPLPLDLMLLVIDNFDSFTYNLVQAFGQWKVEQQIYRNDAITVAQAQALKPSHLLISPGPGTPDQAGISLPMIEAFVGVIPILGVCLGHQCLGQHFGGKVVRASRLMHGKTSPITHQNTDLFQDLPQGFSGTRYHSLLFERISFPKCLEITAETEEGEIMGLRHRTLPIYGVQFHPESFATENGMQLLKNFLSSLPSKDKR